MQSFSLDESPREDNRLTQSDASPAPSKVYGQWRAWEVKPMAATPGEFFSWGMYFCAQTEKG